MEMGLKRRWTKGTTIPNVYVVPIEGIEGKLYGFQAQPKCWNYFFPNVFLNVAAQISHRAVGIYFCDVAPVNLLTIRLFSEPQAIC